MERTLLLDKFRVRVAIILTDNTEGVYDSELITDMQKFGEEGEDHERVKVVALVKLLVEKEILSRIDGFMCEFSEIMQNLPTKWTLAKRLDVHALRAEYDRVDDKCIRWLEKFGKDYSFTVLTAIAGVRVYGKQLYDLQM